MNAQQLESDERRLTESTQQIISNETTSAKRKSERPISHDWVKFVSVNIVMANDLGLLFAFGTVFPYILEHFRESRASTTAIQSIFLGVGQGSGILTGLLVRRFGPRKIGLAGATLYSVGLIASIFATSTVYMHISYGIISGLGFGFLFLSSFQSVGQCFKGQKTLVATSVATASVGVGSVLYPYLIRFLEAKYGLRGMLLILGGITLNSIPLTLTWDNAVPNASSTTFPQKHIKCKICGILFGICRNLKDVLKYSPFPFVLIGIGLSLSCSLVFEVLALDILKSIGLSSDNSMTCYILLQAVSVPGRLLPGFINKIPGFSSIMSPVIGALLGSTVMLLLNYVRNYAGLLVLFVIAGLSRGIIVSCQSIVSLRMLGTTNYSTGLGMILFVSGVFAVSSGPLHGFLRDVSGSYFISLNGTAGVFVLSMFLSLIAMKLHNRIKRRQKDITVDIPVFTITRL